MSVFKTVVAILIGVAIGAGGSFAAARATITARPGDTIMVPSRGVTCGVLNGPVGVICFKQGIPRGSYSAFLTRAKIEVVRNLPNHGSRIVFSAKQP